MQKGELTCQSQILPHSRLRIKDGAHKGRYIGTGAKTLADELSTLE